MNNSPRQLPETPPTSRGTRVGKLGNSSYWRLCCCCCLWPEVIVTTLLPNWVSQASLWGLVLPFVPLCSLVLSEKLFTVQLLQCARRNGGRAGSSVNVSAILEFVIPPSWSCAVVKVNLNESSFCWKVLSFKDSCRAPTWDPLLWLHASCEIVEECYLHRHERNFVDKWHLATFT